MKLSVHYILLVLYFMSFANNAAIKADLVIVKKSERILTLLHKGKEIKQFTIAMGDNPKGQKIKEGDQRTPEGRYTLDYKKSDSAFYKAIHISYPNEADKLRSLGLGVSTGGLIMIHGQNPKSTLPAKEQQEFNWTNGCIAVTNQEMDILWQLIEPDTPIEIWP